MAKTPVKKKAKITSKPGMTALTWPWDAKLTLWISAGIIALLGIIVFWRYVSGEYLYIFEDIGSDTITVFYPNLVHLARYYQEVGIPGWSFYMGPGHGIYPGGLLNPWDWVFYVMDAKSIARSLGYVQLLKIIASGVVFAIFLQKVKLELPVVLIGGILYAFGGYMVVGSGWYIHTTHIFWITVALLGFEMLLREQKWWLFPIPFIFLAGTRGYFLILFMAIYALVRALDYYQGDWKKLIRVYGRMVLCGVIALLITAPFLSGKVSKLVNSPRGTGNVSKQELLSDQPMFKVSPANHNATAVLRWFSNDAIGTGDDYRGWRNYLEGPLFYIGLLTLLLLPQFFLFADKRQKWLYGGLLLFWIWLIIFPWFRFAFYAFAGNYYKGALSLFIPFSFLLVALMALDRMVKGRKVHLPVLAGTLIACLVLLGYPYASLKDGVQPDVQLKVTLFLVAGAAVLAALNFENTRKWSLPALIALVATEAVFMSYPANHDRKAIPAADLQKPLRHFDETHDALDWIRKQDNPLFYRTDKVYGSVKTGYNDALVQGFFGTKMYQSHNSKFYVQFLEDMGVIPRSNEASSRWLVGVSKRNFLHPLMSTQYILTKKETKGDVHKDIYTSAHKTGPVEIFKNKYYIPFGIPFDRYFKASEFLTLDSGQKLEAIYHGVILPDEDAGRVRGLTPIGPADVTYGGSSIIPIWQQLRQDAMKMTSFDHNHITGTVNLRKPSVLFFSLVYDDAWHVYVDGKEQELMLVDIGFSGVMVDAGQHDITLKYIPPMSRVGWIFFAAGLAVYGYLQFRKVKLLPVA